MNTYHIMYTKDGEFFQTEMKHASWKAAERWCESIGASYWEISLFQEN